MAILTKNQLEQFINDNPDNFTRQLKFYHKDLYSAIDTKYQHSKFAQKVYHFIHGDDIGKCLVCNNLSIFESITKGYRKYCSYECSGKAKKEQSREIRNCKICKKEFEVYKKDKKLYCSTECRLLNNKLNAAERVSKSVESSKRNHGGLYHMCLPEHRVKSNETKLKKYDNINYVNVDKNKKTKLERYGNSNYNNQEKVSNTVLQKYGVRNIFHLYRSNGIQISKPQRKYYKKIKQEYPDAIIEHYLQDVHVSVDIYIPSEKRIIEIYGDYWHCNPKIFTENIYHKQLHMTAKEKWEFDSNRIRKIEAAGYNVTIVWESDIKL